MARLSQDQWSTLRERWESSPRAGFDWLREWLESVTNGACSISREGLRQRAKRERWAKRERGDTPGALTGAAVAELACDGKLGRALGAFAMPRDFDPAGDLDAACEAMMVRHRQDWAVLRVRLSDAWAAAKAHDTTDINFRSIKLVADAIRIMHADERLAYDMDTAASDLDSMTDHQLEEVAAGRRPRKSR